MSDCLKEIDHLKIKDGLLFGSDTSPHLKKTFTKQDRVALTISLTNEFVRLLHTSHEKTGLSYLTLINTQVEYFQLRQSERLLLRLTKTV